uniref:ATP synthase F0 subunit 8 n=1 Tax=Dendrothrips minowai TaxID=1030662 RepID=A0A343WRP4_9NEOP|nr:ATP synthase F0 subunit 8 [Dendrothrips minowai]AWD37113.1 ATP synthase F0 subunit 8 [Dendrothrips minowai]
MYQILPTNLFTPFAFSLLSISSILVMIVFFFNSKKLTKNKKTKKNYKDLSILSLFIS